MWGVGRFAEALRADLRAMEVKVRLGPTQRTLMVPLYPPPTLAKFQTDVIKLFKLPADVTLNVSYKNEKNQFILVHSEGDFNDVRLASRPAVI